MTGFVARVTFMYNKSKFTIETQTEKDKRICVPHKTPNAREIIVHNQLISAAPDAPDLELSIRAAVLDVLGQVGQTQRPGQRGIQEVFGLRELSKEIRSPCVIITHLC